MGEKISLKIVKGQRLNILNNNNNNKSFSNLSTDEIKLQKRLG